MDNVIEIGFSVQEVLCLMAKEAVRQKRLPDDETFILSMQVGKGILLIAERSHDLGS